MARKKKNKIFEQTASAEDTTQLAAVDVVEQSNDALVPEVSKESMVEDVPDSAEQMDILEDNLSEMSRLQAELHISKQRIAELEAEVKQLQSDNDMLVMKLAENAATQVELPQQPQCTIQTQPISNVETQTTTQLPKRQLRQISKQVQYRYPNYGNNGYGTWH